MFAINTCIEIFLYAVRRFLHTSFAGRCDVAFSRTVRSLLNLKLLRSALRHWISGGNVLGPVGPVDFQLMNVLFEIQKHVITVNQIGKYFFPWRISISILNQKLYSTSTYDMVFA